MSLQRSASSLMGPSLILPFKISRYTRKLVFKPLNSSPRYCVLFAVSYLATMSCICGKDWSSGKDPVTIVAEGQPDMHFCSVVCHGFFQQVKSKGFSIGTENKGGGTAVAALVQPATPKGSGNTTVLDFEEVRVPGEEILTQEENATLIRVREVRSALHFDTTKRSAP